LAFDKSLVKKIPFGWPEEKQVKELAQFFNRQRAGFDAVFFTSNNLGVAGLEAFSNLGINVPEQVSVICFDDNDLFRLGKPGITVVSQPIKQMAKKAVEVLVRQIEQSGTEPSNIVLATQMVERDSVRNKSTRNH
jgi:LacI family transcriptional regulator